MWTVEPPAQPVAEPQAIYIAAKSAPEYASPKDRVLGVCEKVEINTGDDPQVALFSVNAAADYMYMYEKKSNFFGDGKKAKLALLTPPKHGKVEMSGEAPVSYSPDEGYDGKDSFAVQIEQDGVTVKVQYFILIDHAAELKYIDCVEGPKGSTGSWKISQSNVSVLGAIKLASLRRPNELAALFANAGVEFPSSRK